MSVFLADVLFPLKNLNRINKFSNFPWNWCLVIRLMLNSAETPLLFQMLRLSLLLELGKLPLHSFLVDLMIERTNFLPGRRFCNLLKMAIYEHSEHLIDC